MILMIKAMESSQSSRMNPMRQNLEIKARIDDPDRIYSILAPHAVQGPKWKSLTPIF